MYTLDDLEEARYELRHWNEKFGNDRSNNPNKYEAQIRDAGIKVRAIENYLKDQGILERIDSEILQLKLDQLFPNAKSNSIHEYNGKKYKIRYFPLVQSRSRKTVKEWGYTWEEQK